MVLRIFKYVSRFFFAKFFIKVIFKSILKVYFCFNFRWPLAKKFYDKQFKETEQEESDENKKKDEKNLFKETGINCARIIRYYVFQIIHKYYYDDDPIDDTKKLEHIFHKYFKDEFNEIIKKPENIIKYYFFLDELKVLIAQSSR